MAWNADNHNKVICKRSNLPLFVTVDWLRATWPSVCHCGVSWMMSTTMWIDAIVQCHSSSTSFFILHHFIYLSPEAATSPLKQPWNSTLLSIPDHTRQKPSKTWQPSQSCEDPTTQNARRSGGRSGFGTSYNFLQNCKIEDKPVESINKITVHKETYIFLLYIHISWIEASTTPATIGPNSHATKTRCLDLRIVDPYAPSG